MAINKFQGETRWLSNFEVCNVEIEGKVYKTTEHAYQALKSIDPEEQEMVRRAATAGKAKRLGRKVKMRPDWDEVKIDYMYAINWQKFHQNPELKLKLIQTGNEELIEGNTWGDKFWGVCGGKGRNELGKILMEIRHRILHSKHTTDGWTEEFYAAFAKDVDANIRMLSGLDDPDQQYTLRRMIMISLRHGPCSAHKMTDRIEALEAELKAMKEAKGEE